MTSNDQNGLEQWDEWSKIASNFKVLRTKKLIKNILQEYYSEEFQSELSILSDNQKLKNGLIPLYLANVTRCQKHIAALKGLFTDSNNLLFRSIIQRGERINLDFLFRNNINVMTLSESVITINLQFLFDIVDDPMKKNEKGVSMIHLASYFGELDVIKIFVELYPKCVNAIDKDGVTPFMEAADGGQIEVLKYFLNLPKSIRPNIKLTTRECGSVVHQAAGGANNNVDTLKLLIPLIPEWKTLTDGNGFTPFDFAALHDRADSATFLLSLEVLTKTEVKKALDIAKSEDSSRVVSVLKDAIKSMSIDKNGLTKNKDKKYGLF